MSREINVEGLEEVLTLLRDAVDDDEVQIRELAARLEATAMRARDLALSGRHSEALSLIDSMKDKLEEVKFMRKRARCLS